MARWKLFMDKKVYIILKNNRHYSGKIIDVDDSNKPLVWITILDKFGSRIIFSTAEIELIQEEKR